MTWTATKSNKRTELGNANIVVDVTFANDATGETFTEVQRGNTLTDDYLAIYAAQKIALLNQRDMNLDLVTEGKIATVDPVTPDQQSANDFFTLKAKLDATTAAIAQGLVKPDQAYTDLQAEVKEAFLSEYMTDFRWR